MWEKLAGRQQQLREEAEEKNARLKLAVKHHQNLADVLSSFLRRRATQLSNGLAAMAISPTEVHMREGVNGKYRCLEFFSYKILPFELNATTEATWAYFKGVEKHLGYGNLYNKAAKVIRRYVEADRDVVIRVYRAVPVEIKHKLLSRLTYYLQGYAVTKRAPMSTPERELSILQLCTVVCFDQEEAAAATHELTPI
uniref:Uncharacterized protein n=1 Tax=Phytophthora ramorum TaxID=164328 RepID=H3HCD5_PHYRM